MQQYDKYQTKRRMHTKPDDILCCDTDVVMATGIKVLNINILNKNISLGNENSLFALNHVSEDTYAIINTKPEKDGLIQSYHPSLTFKYGNSTILNKV